MDGKRSGFFFVLEFFVSFFFSNRRGLLCFRQILNLDLDWFYRDVHIKLIKGKVNKYGRVIMTIMTIWNNSERKLILISILI